MVVWQRYLIADDTTEWQVRRLTCGYVNVLTNVD